jgi:hypothetical protein
MCELAFDDLAGYSLHGSCDGLVESLPLAIGKQAIELSRLAVVVISWDSRTDFPSK